jgi:hypothetical protein
MKKILVIGAVLAALAACTPVKAVTGTALGAGQVVLGAADVIL